MCTPPAPVTGSMTNAAMRSGPTSANTFSTPSRSCGATVFSPASTPQPSRLAGMPTIDVP